MSANEWMTGSQIECQQILALGGEKIGHHQDARADPASRSVMPSSTLETASQRTPSRSSTRETFDCAVPVRVGLHHGHDLNVFRTHGPQLAIVLGDLRAGHLHPRAV
jgi:hypothetical protein